MPPDLRLRPRSAHSYDTTDTLGLEAWLLARGCTPERPRSAQEHARLRSPGGVLFVLYHSGAVSLQGTNIDAAKRALARFVVPQEEVCT